MARVYIDADVDVDVEEFLDSCSPREIQKVIKQLKEDGHLENIIDIFLNKNMSYFDEEWYQMLDKMSKIRHQMDNQDIEIIKLILKKY